MILCLFEVRYFFIFLWEESYIYLFSFCIRKGLACYEMLQYITILCYMYLLTLKKKNCSFALLDQCESSTLYFHHSVSVIVIIVLYRYFKYSSQKLMDKIGLVFWFVVFNATFNNISIISWQSVLLVEETWRKPPTCRKSLTIFRNKLCWNVTLMNPVRIWW